MTPNTPMTEMPVELTEYQGIIERVRAATGADRELDCRIEAALVHKAELRIVPPPTFTETRYFANSLPGLDWIGYDLLNTAPAYTGSTDAALALAEKVLPGWRYDLHSPRFATPFEAVLMDGDSASRRIVTAEAPTAPLAIILATLLALQSQEPK